MNIQISDLNINNIKPELIKKYLITRKYTTLIFSESNILELRDDGLWRVEPKDTPVITCKIGKYEILIDKSKWIKHDEYFQIQKKHFHIKNTQTIYKLNNKSVLKLIIEEENNCITNLFFKTDEIIDIEMIKNDMITLLSCLNLY